MSCSETLEFSSDKPIELTSIGLYAPQEDDQKITAKISVYRYCESYRHKTIFIPEQSVELKNTNTEPNIMKIPLNEDKITNRYYFSSDAKTTISVVLTGTGYSGVAMERLDTATGVNSKAESNKTVSFKFKGTGQIPTIYYKVKSN